MQLVNQLKHLSKMFDPKLKLSPHTEMVKNKHTLRGNLGFIKRTCGALSSPITLKILYFFIFRFNLEYFPLIWINNTSKQNLRLESVQNNFLRFISYKFNINRPLQDTYT